MVATRRAQGNFGYLTPDGRARLRKAAVKTISTRGWPWPPTKLEYALQLLLESANYEYEAQKPLADRVVDFFVSSHNLVFEADGEYWHRDKTSERKRDSQIISAGVSAIIHLEEKDLDPWMVNC